MRGSEYTYLDAFFFLWEKKGDPLIAHIGSQCFFALQEYLNKESPQWVGCSVCIRNSLGVVYNMQGLTLGATLAKPCRSVLDLVA